MRACTDGYDKRLPYRH